MKGNDINLIRDSAMELMNYNKLAAYQLFVLALNHRPDGGLLIEQEAKLKEELKLKTFVLIGNCQMEALADLIKFKNTSFQVKSVIQAHIYKHDKNIYNIFNNADYIITQNISEKFEGINTKKLKEIYKDKIIITPGLFFKGEHPDWFYPPRINNKRLLSPIGDYHNKTIMDSYSEGLSIQAAIDRLNDYNYNYKKYKNEALLSIQELENREKSCDTKISDIIKESYTKGESQFHSFNHPNKKLMNLHCNRILDFLNLEFNPSATPGECLAWDKLSNNILYSKNKTSIFKLGKEITQEKFVKQSFEIYSQNPDYMKKYSQ